ncbi:predicted protein [Uncinocarpus reesii 1704]|uniref:Uncharacterized protein n=1 Tax=Uncinocarpus reesii (strain UAMH 1704) TaxID=336963 RepID=C4JMK5_UNCRE|nr:uncharacterized protein UREG_04063 [Uncinocarpus reesii 1704]EEP79217.1 predicted protein [Uncinocarpus reesii 1704]
MRDAVPASSRSATTLTSSKSFSTASYSSITASPLLKPRSYSGDHGSKATTAVFLTIAAVLALTLVCALFVLWRWNRRRKSSAGLEPPKHIDGVKRISWFRNE